MRTRFEAGAASRRWVALAAAAGAAMVFASTANAATLTQASCSESAVPGLYNIGISGSGFAPNSVVAVTWSTASGLPLPIMETFVATDGSGGFSGLLTVAMDTPGSPGSAFPVSYTASDLAGNSASLTVTSCGGGGGGGGDPVQPTTKDECKQGGYSTFTEAGFKNQGQCVSTVASKKK